jgi:hypothetical protein
MAAKQRGKRPGRRRIVKEPVRLSVDYEREDFEALEAIATERQTSVASIVRQAAREFVKRERGK